MRITTGRLRSRVIQMPKGIRPTRNLVRKALFDILGDIEGLSFLELFAGSGAVGFEAVSRGADGLTLVEYNRDCLAAIKKNIEHLALKNCSLLPQEAERAIRGFSRQRKRFDIIFLDPPYYGETAKKTLQTLSDCDILAPCGYIVVQHFKKDDLPAQLGVFGLFKDAKYGDTVLSFYQKGKTHDVPEGDLPGQL